MVRSILIKNKKAQGWGLDVFVAITLFIAGVIILYVYAINYVSQSNNIVEEMSYEANLVSNLILSEDDFGILTKGIVNQTKLEDFDSSYLSRKGSFGMKRDFYFTIGDPIEFIGQLNTSQTSNLVKVTRITIYKNTPTKLEVYVYEE